jgi:hypothetical protein
MKVNKIRKKVTEAVDSITDYLNLILSDPRPPGVSIAQALTLHLAGYRAEKHYLYDVKRNRNKGYLSDVQRWKARRSINKRYNILLDDKILATKLLSPYILVPEILAFIRRGQAHNINGEALEWRALAETLIRVGTVLSKPTLGAGGRDIRKVSCQNSSWSLNGEKVTERDILDYLKGLDNFVLSRFVEQDEYGVRLYPHTTNTIRLLTIREPASRAVIAPAAVHRIGTRATIPVDSFSKGGISAPINIDTGELGCGARKGALDRVPDPVSVHPDTGAPITGVHVPRWDSIKQSVIHAHSTLPQLNLIAWDLVLTRDGPCAIEANASTDFGVFQVHGPMPPKGVLRSFYKHYGVG